ncbi:MAG TPA: hypothetical protein V6C64_09020, partial [Microcoleaceae cyanobacterium]
MPESGDTSRQRSNNSASLFKRRHKALRLREPASAGTSAAHASNGLSPRSQTTPDRHKPLEPLNSKSSSRDGKGEVHQATRPDWAKGQSGWWRRFLGRRSRTTAKEGATQTELRLGKRQQPASAKDSSNSNPERGLRQRDRAQLLPKLNPLGRSGSALPLSGNTPSIEKNRDARRQPQEPSRWPRRGRGLSPSNRDTGHRPALRLGLPNVNTVLPLRPGQPSESQEDGRRSASHSAQSPESTNRFARSRRQRRERRSEQRPLPEPKQRQPRPAPRPKSRSAAIVLYATRMLILSIGVGVLAGTVLSAWDPATHSFLTGNVPNNQPSTQAMSVAPAPELKVGQEIAELKTAMQPLGQQNPQFTLGVYLQDLDDNGYLDMGGSDTFAAAS